MVLQISETDEINKGINIMKKYIMYYNIPYSLIVAVVLIFFYNTEKTWANVIFFIAYFLAQFLAFLPLCYLMAKRKKAGLSTSKEG